MKKHLGFVLLGLGLPSALALAQADTAPPPPPPPPPPSTASTAVAPPPPPAPQQNTTVYVQQDAAASTPPPPKKRKPQHEASFYLGVPVWFTPEDGSVDPGFGLWGRYGFVVKPWLVPEFTMGWQINGIDNNIARQNITLDSFFFGLGLRLKAVNDSMVTPFISASFDMSIWHLTGDTSVGCGIYWCAPVANYEFSLGLSSMLGLGLRVSEGVSIDLGARLATVFAMGLFNQVQGWVTPFAGITGHL